MKLNYFCHLICLMFLLNTTLSQEIICEESFIEPEWSNLGPFIDETSHLGRISAVWVDPNNQNKIIIGTMGSGLWQTTNGGSNWTNLFSYELPGVGIQKIVNVHVDVEGPDYDIDAIYGYGIFGSTHNRYGLGLTFYDPFTGTWQKEPIENYPEDFKFELQKNRHKSMMAYRPNSYQLWVGNNKNIFIRNTVSHFVRKHPLNYIPCNKISKII